MYGYTRVCNYIVSLQLVEVSLWCPGYHHPKPGCLLASLSKVFFLFPSSSVQFSVYACSQQHERIPSSFCCYCCSSGIAPHTRKLKKTLSQKFVQSFVKLVKGIFKRWNNFQWKCVHTKAMDHYCISLHNISKNVLFIEFYHKGSFLGVRFFRDYCFLGVQFSWWGFRGLGVHFFRGTVF